MALHLSNRRVLLTGASRGLGEAIAIRLARDGASVALVARGEPELQSLANRLTADPMIDGQTFLAIAADLSYPKDIDRAVEICQSELGEIDILVNNAATQGPIGPLESADFVAWRESFDINLFTPARLCQLVIPAMRRRGAGKIINISGGGATSPRPDFTAYAAAKCALVRLTETLAEELKGAGIDVNAVSPGAMNTRMLDEVLEAGPHGASREYSAALTRRREGGASMKDAADLVAMLASSSCDGISGRLISAVWDDWKHLFNRRDELAGTDLYTLRRVTTSEKKPVGPSLTIK
ncbi:MAG TPA: SDR family oxidoreductase [Tepidisphaeraceae bacterium]|jgi:3-oxoacyl-[acyl-carrier protein] reductase|nr:SDR family oxidoreductase [Tepidisphaeraceae bacterium]